MLMIPSQGYVAFNLRGSRKQRPIASLSLHAGCGPLVNKENLPKNHRPLKDAFAQMREKIPKWRNSDGSHPAQA